MAIAPGSGGARKGAGRPKGSTDLRTNKMYARLTNDGGVLPLEVMVMNMRKAYKMALEAERKAIEQADQLTQEERLQLVKEEWAARREAHEFAVSAAPYMHSKLATLELTGEGGGPIKTEDVTRPKLSKEEWLAAHGVGTGGVTDVTPKEKP